MRGILYLVSTSVAAMMVMLALPVVVAYSENSIGIVSTLGIIGVLGLMISASITLALRGRTSGLQRRNGPVAVAVVWFFSVLFGALPLWAIYDLSPIEALFESVSGLTTTSITLLPKLPELPLAVAIWRSQLEWFGGFLTLASVLHILAPTGLGGLPQLEARFAQVDDSNAARFLPQIRRLLGRYFIISLSVFLVLILMGTQVTPAFFLTSSVMATSGYLPTPQSVEQLVSVLGLLVLSLAMLGSAIGIYWVPYRPKNGWLTVIATREAAAISIFIVLIIILYFGLLKSVSTTTSLNTIAFTFAESAFTAVSLVSTSGLETRFGVIALAPSILVLIVIFVGGSILSTSGGIKIYRIIALASLSWRELAFLIYPSQVARQRVARTFFSDGSVSTVWVVFTLAILTLAFGTFLFDLSGFSFEAAFTFSTALLSNSGPIYEALVPPAVDNATWPAISDLPPVVLCLAMIMMIVGRLEIIAIIIALGYFYWRKKT